LSGGQANIDVYLCVSRIYPSEMRRMPPIPPDQCSPYGTEASVETAKVHQRQGDRASGDEDDDDSADVKAERLKAKQLKAERLKAKLAARRNDLLKSGCPVYYRFDDIVAAGLVQNRTSLGRLINEEGFPPGMMIGANTRVWRVSDIEAWIATRSSARKALPPNAGNPRAKRREVPT
jgi:predicted DNA-binding transcriptional regulator AlpA